MRRSGVRIPYPPLRTERERRLGSTAPNETSWVKLPLKEIPIRLGFLLGPGWSMRRATTLLHVLFLENALSTVPAERELEPSFLLQRGPWKFAPSILLPM